MTQTLKVQILAGGYCSFSERMVYRKGAREEIRFPSMFALIHHPKKGYILFDTGYSQHFYEATQNYPYRLYAKVTPVVVSAEETALAQLKRLGIQADDISYIVVSHFHGDHISALNDFPKARFICMKHGYEFVKGLTGMKATNHGFLPPLVPPDFESRVDFIDWDLGRFRVAPVYPFEYTFDFFEDGSMLFIPLDGHYKGQVGVLIQLDQERSCFLVADACWLTKNYKEMVLPHPLAMQMMHSRSQYKRDLQHIHDFYRRNPKTVIIPSHCSHAIESYQAELNGSALSD